MKASLKRFHYLLMVAWTVFLEMLVECVCHLYRVVWVTCKVAVVTEVEPFHKFINV